jgi:glycosyltransferase involved in cell wall biosynthesis
MHVVIFSEHFHKNPSGPRLSVIETSRALVRAGVKVTILSLSPENIDEDVPGVGVARLRRYSWKLVPVRYGRHRFCARMLHDVHRRDPIDAVVAMGTWAGAGCVLFRRRTGVPFVLNPRSRISHKPGDWHFNRERDVVLGCDAFVGISECEVAGWCDDLKIDRDHRFFAVHNGFNPAVLEGDAEPLAGVPTDVPLILCMGMLRKAKGQHRLMSALDTMGDLPWFAVLAGGGRDRGQEWVRQRHAEMRLKDRVLLPGVVTGAPWRWLYRQATVFCLAPVYPEAAGNVFLEAQAAGLPIVTSNAGGNVELVSPDSAIVVQRGDGMTRDIAEALRRLLADTELRKRMGEAGRKRAATFTWDRTSEGYLAAIEHALGSKEWRALAARK